jgi:NADP-dependent 3-hydroxy acid dehydrogenase YdfG
MATEMAPPEGIDINTIPLDAPLSISEPSRSWILGQNQKGTNRKKEVLPAVDLTGKWIIVSGSNNGIGREAVLQFAAWGANLVLACRASTPAWETQPGTVVQECRERAKEAGHADTEIEWWELDCASLESVEDFAIRWLKTERSLDVLCNNAGTLRDTRPPDAKAKHLIP